LGVFYDAQVDRDRSVKVQRLLRGRVVRVIGGPLLIVARCVLGVAVVWVTFLELALTLLVKVGPGGYTGEDGDYALWRDLMPWTIGLWIVVVALIVRRVRRHRAGRT